MGWFTPGRMKIRLIMIEKNFLIMHAIGTNTGGQVGSVTAATIMLSVLKIMVVI